MSTATVFPATERQVEFIKDLIDGRDLLKSPKIFDACNAMDAGEFEAYKEQLKENAALLSKDDASVWIDRLLKLPKLIDDSAPSVLPPISTNVPEGRYAITGRDGTTDFYKVDRPDKGRWAGYTFVKLLLGGPHGHPREERIPRRNVQSVLDRIEEDGPKAASQRYGHELGQCGVCGRTLTNEDSRELGIGPVCAAGRGWS